MCPELFAGGSGSDVIGASVLRLELLRLGSKARSSRALPREVQLRESEPAGMGGIPGWSLRGRIFGAKLSRAMLGRLVPTVP
jgi:hypothetical protein